MENFSLVELKAKYDRAPNIPKVYNNKPVIGKDISECTAYINRYFFALKSGGHFYLEDGKFKFHDDKEIRSIYFKRMPVEIQIWYFNENLNLYSTINSIHKPQIDGNKINLCSGIKVKAYKKYAEYSKEIIEGVELILTHIREVMCNDVVPVYEYYLKLISNICKGKKNDVIIYQKSIEGTGKSTTWDFIIKHVLGREVCIKSNVDPLKTSNNSSLCGKLLVLFEELPTFTKNDWTAVSSKLKDMATGDTMIWCNKYEKAFEAENINNYVINTNVDAIKSADGRRYFINEISTKRLKDYAYFGLIKTKCFNDAVGEAFYSFMMEIDTEDFVPQRDMPETRNKLNAIVSRLDPVYLFLKECYILKRKNIKAKTPQFYSEYKDFCNANEYREVGKVEFFTKLREINIDYKKTNGNHMYNVSYQTLQELADKFHWIHETDVYKNPQADILDDEELGVEDPNVIHIELHNPKLSQIYKQMKQMNFKFNTL